MGTGFTKAAHTLRDVNLQLKEERDAMRLREEKYRKNAFRTILLELELKGKDEEVEKTENTVRGLIKEREIIERMLNEMSEANCVLASENYKLRNGELHRLKSENLDLQEEVMKLQVRTRLWKAESDTWKFEYETQSKIALQEINLNKGIVSNQIWEMQDRIDFLENVIRTHEINGAPKDPECVEPLKLRSAERVLILGEEDFSFTKAINRFVDVRNIVTTSFHKCHDISHVASAVTTFTGVDATQIRETLPSYLPMSRFDRIFFMFPWPVDHDSQDPISALRDLIAKFLHSALECLLPGGLIIVSLYGVAQIARIDMRKLSQECGMQCESYHFGEIWESALNEYIPWIPGATDLLISQRGVVYVIERAA